MMIISGNNQQLKEPTMNIFSIIHAFLYSQTKDVPFAMIYIRGDHTI